MRHLASAMVIAIGFGLLSLPGARAQVGNDQPVMPPGHPKQHQDVKPPSPQDGTTRRDQSAQAPQSPSVITPPATGDHSVITPPATGAAKMPVIPPPGTPGGNNDIVPE
jgi:hypothetical protein